MYIDTHCHLDFSHFNDDRAIVVGNAKKAGVKKFINPGVDIASSARAVELAIKNRDVIFAGIGFHPNEAQKNSDIKDLEKLLRQSTLNTKPYPLNHVIVAIGECGLDYHQYIGEKAAGKKDNQKRLFENQLRLTLENRFPVILHCRDAYEDFFDVLDALPDIPAGVIHCFSGGLEDLRMARKRGLYVGIDGNVTYSKQLSLIVPQIPLSILLLETDAPYLTPAPYRGTRNEPKYIPLVAKKIAELTNQPVKVVEKQTTINALSLFQFSQSL